MAPSVRALRALCPLLPLLAPATRVTRPALLLQEPGAGTAPVLEFYAYRAGQAKWPSKNSERQRSQNLANAAGVLRYVHNEVVGRNVAARARPPHCERKYDIDKIYRYKVTMRSTPEALRRHSSGFLGFVAIDKAKCTVPKCDEVWWKPYGYVPGCQDQDVAAFYYADAVWYSFPGRCPGRTRSEPCRPDKEELADPGGACRPMHTEDGEKVVPRGTWNCTYVYEPAGELDLDELVGIKAKYGDYRSFCMQGGVEFNGPNDGDVGVTLDFWKGYSDVERNERRVAAMLELFAEKYPKMQLLDDPSCGKPWVRPSYWPGGAPGPAPAAVPPSPPAGAAPSTPSPAPALATTPAPAPAPATTEPPSTPPASTTESAARDGGSGGGPLLLSAVAPPALAAALLARAG